MFDKNLQDLVRGIRNHKEDEVKKKLHKNNTEQKRCHLKYLKPFVHECLFNSTRITKYRYRRPASSRSQLTFAR